ncbi:MAG TPA: hypothetical protein VL137_13955 [Polyangiaceae bacterium]|nr:hypothetical protein [Polyangiaceae bacterium]
MMRRMGQNGAGRRQFLAALTLSVAGLPVMAGCGGRDSKWDAEPISASDLKVVALSDSVVVADPALNRVLVLAGSSRGELQLSNAPIGQGLLSLWAVPGADRVLALSAGVQPRLRSSDEKASLTVVSGGLSAKVVARYELEQAFSKITVDPQGQWVVLAGDDKASGNSGAVVNPNELVLIDISDRRFVPVRKTLASFGSQPLRYTFTGELHFPDGTSGRLLLVETERDLTVINLANPEANEITVQFQKTQGDQVAKPAGLSYHDSTDVSATQIAVRFEGQSDVILIDMIADDTQTHPFKLLPQLVDAGGIPSALELVNTDQGVRLAALLPTTSRAALIDPQTTIAQFIDLAAPYTQFTLTTPEGTAGADEALLWGANVTNVAFWALGQTGEQAFRSIESLELQTGVGDVVEMPGSSRRRLLQAASGGQFFVLDLDRRQAFPMSTQFGHVQLSVSPDGKRAWAFEHGALDFGMIDLETMHVTALRVDRPVDRVFDIQQPGNHSLAIALHAQGDLAATTLDGHNPDSTLSRFYGGLLLGGLQ